jgi:hypothetical protein
LNTAPPATIFAGLLERGLKLRHDRLSGLAGGNFRERRQEPSDSCLQKPHADAPPLPVPQRSAPNLIVT